MKVLIIIFYLIYLRLIIKNKDIKNERKNHLTHVMDFRFSNNSFFKGVSNTNGKGIFLNLIKLIHKKNSPLGNRNYYRLFQKKNLFNGRYNMGDNMIKSYEHDNF